MYIRKVFIKGVSCQNGRNIVVNRIINGELDLFNIIIIEITKIFIRLLRLFNKSF